LFFAYQYVTSEIHESRDEPKKPRRDVRRAGIGTLFPKFRQLLSQSETIDSGPELEMVKRVAGCLAVATGHAESNFDWKVSLIKDRKERKA
jgi:hypothetical protein